MAEQLIIRDELWITPTVDGYKLGLTNETQAELGDITFVSLPKIGQTLTKGEAFAEVEAEKAVSEFSAPFSGTVSAVNTDAQTTPSILDDPQQTNAWLVELSGVQQEEV